MIEIIIEKFLEMFILVLIGIIVFKCRLITSSANHNLSNLLLLVVSPALIINSYQMDYNKDLFYGLIWCTLISFMTFFIIIFISKFFISLKSKEYDIEKIASIYSNCGFVGIPIINGLLGQKGIFYITIYIAIFNIFVWTHGVLVMEKNASKLNLYRNLFSPAILSVLVGIFLFITQIRLPEFLNSPIEMIGNMNTPLAMIIAGGNIAQTNIVQTFKKKSVYYVSFLKLILFPLISSIILILLPVSFEIKFSILIAISCPTGATVIMFAERYEKNAKYASELFAITTIFSVITIPIISILFSNLSNIMI